MHIDDFDLLYYIRLSDHRSLRFLILILDFLRLSIIRQMWFNFWILLLGLTGTSRRLLSYFPLWNHYIPRVLIFIQYFFLNLFVIQMTFKVVRRIFLFINYLWSSSLIIVDFNVCHRVFSPCWVNVLLAFYSFGEHVFETFLNFNFNPFFLKYLLDYFMYHSCVSVIMLILRIVMCCYCLHHALIIGLYLILICEIVCILRLYRIGDTRFIFDLLLETILGFWPKKWFLKFLLVRISFNLILLIRFLD